MIFNVYLSTIHLQFLQRSGPVLLCIMHDFLNHTMFLNPRFFIGIQKVRVHFINEALRRTILYLLLVGTILYIILVNQRTYRCSLDPYEVCRFIVFIVFTFCNMTNLDLEDCGLYLYLSQKAKAAKKCYPSRR